MNMDFIGKLPIPQEIKAQYPVPPEASAVKARRDAEIKNIFTGKDNRLLLVIGPCSADNEVSVLDYISRLRGVQDKVSDKILIVPRIYTNKPRSTGAGYKGMLHQPDIHKSEDMLAGIIAIRQLHIKVMQETGFVCADEMLYPENYAYLSDVLGYVAVGARSVENQQHRMVASSIDVPTGMKNPTGGDLSVMINAIVAAQAKQKFVYRGFEVETQGNPLSHAILRGYVDKYNNAFPNYHYEDLEQLVKMYKESNLAHPAVIVDCNHSNSGKKYEQQARIADDIIHSCEVSEEINRLVKGLMIESYLVDGCQKPGGEVYGQSITDPCLGWEKSEKLIYSIYNELKNKDLR